MTKTQEKQCDFKTLVELSTMINSSLDMEAVLNNAMECVQVSMNSEASAIFELDREQGDLFFRIALGSAADRARDMRVKLGEGVAGWVAKTGEPLIISDTRTDPRFLPFVDSRTGFETRSILCVPIVFKGELCGVLQVLNKQDERGFDSNDLEMLTILANQLAIALENARLYMRLNEKFALTEEELRTAQEKLIQSERLAALGRLSEGIAHEVRNPVMIIGGFVRRLQKQFGENDSIRETAEIVLKQTERLEQMVTDIGEFARMRQPHPKPLELPATVNAVIASLSGLIESRGIRVERKYSEAIAPLKADGELLELALRNILINALEAMPSGGTLTISICSQPGSLLLSIRDTGTGIRSEDLPNIFDPFFTSKTQGSGLGLTAVHRVIYDHSGDIVVDSAPGEGTEVRIRLPNR